jgi:hypothetical protein
MSLPLSSDDIKTMEDAFVHQTGERIQARRNQLNAAQRLFDGFLESHLLKEVFSGYRVNYDKNNRVLSIAYDDTRAKPNTYQLALRPPVFALQCILEDRALEQDEEVQVYRRILKRKRDPGSDDDDEVKEEVSETLSSLLPSSSAPAAAVAEGTETPRH